MTAREIILRLVETKDIDKAITVFDRDMREQRGILCVGRCNDDTFFIMTRDTDQQND